MAKFTSLVRVIPSMFRREISSAVSMVSSPMGPSHPLSTSLWYNTPKEKQATIDDPIKPACRSEIKNVVESGEIILDDNDVRRTHLHSDVTKTKSRVVVDRNSHMGVVDDKSRTVTTRELRKIVERKGGDSWDPMTLRDVIDWDEEYDPSDEPNRHLGLIVNQGNAVKNKAIENKSLEPDVHRHLTRQPHEDIYNLNRDYGGLSNGKYHEEGMVSGPNYWTNKGESNQEESKEEKGESNQESKEEKGESNQESKKEKGESNQEERQRLQEIDEDRIREIVLREAFNEMTDKEVVNSFLDWEDRRRKDRDVSRRKAVEDIVQKMRDTKDLHSRGVLEDIIERIRGISAS